MAKSKKSSPPSEKDLEKSFEIWENAITGLIDKSNQSMMPLVAHSLKLTLEIIQMYKTAFINLRKNMK
jgi:hypothetical protein